MSRKPLPAPDSGPPHARTATGCPAADRRHPQLRDLTDRLRREARRVTGPRQAILSLLQAHPHPLTNKEIFQALPSGQCDLATVYRSVHLLESMGLVTRYDFGDGVARFEVARDGAHGHHHHLICTDCSAVVEIEDCLASAWEERIARESGFKMVTHKLEFFGRCPRCQHESAKTRVPAPPDLHAPVRRHAHP